MTKPLPVGSSSVYVMFPQPKTNVDWFRCTLLMNPYVLQHIQFKLMADIDKFIVTRYVEAEPSWAKQLEGEMTLGRKRIVFRFLNLNLFKDGILLLKF